VGYLIAETGVRVHNNCLFTLTSVHNTHNINFIYFVLQVLYYGILVLISTEALLSTIISTVKFCDYKSIGGDEPKLMLNNNIPAFFLGIIRL
jgi:hypothetical protein